MASAMKALVKQARAEGARLEQVPVPSPQAEKYW